MRNAANFSNDVWHNLFHHMFGGLNYHIEHHLFPTVSHTHLPKITPVLKKTCAEFGIPYVAKASVFAALRSVLNGFVRETDDWDRKMDVSDEAKKISAEIHGFRHTRE